MLDTPILFLVFNRLDTTKQVLAAIRKAQPRQLFIAADGPRPTKVGEYEKCLEVRETVDDSIDWPCEVHRLYRENNSGSGPAVSEAITWFFSQIEMGIILEDDCLPDDSFFEYADKVLHRYANDERIMHVSGHNLQCGMERGKNSYYFSKLPATWGWATWKRAWIKFSFDFYQDTDSDIINVLSRSLGRQSYVDYYFNEIQATKNNLVSAWDYQWFYVLMRNDAISITPQSNLIINLGFDAYGTHTFTAPYWYKYLVNKPLRDMSFDEEIIINEKADSFYLSLTMGRRTIETIYIKGLYKLKKVFGFNQ